MSANVSLDQILGELDKAESLSDQQILNSLFSRTDLALKTQIPFPISAIRTASLKLFADHCDKVFGKSAGKPIHQLVQYTEEYSVSYERQSRKEVVEAIRKSPAAQREVQQTRRDLLSQLYNR